DIEQGMPSPAAICGHRLAAQVELLALLCEQVHAVPPRPERVAAWRKRYLRIWEAEIDDYGPDAEYKAKRREVIDATFTRLDTAAERWHCCRNPESLADGQEFGPSGHSTGPSPAIRPQMKFYVQEPLECEPREIGIDPDPDLIASTMLGLEWADITFASLE